MPVILITLLNSLSWTLWLPGNGVKDTITRGVELSMHDEGGWSLAMTDKNRDNHPSSLPDNLLSKPWTQPKDRQERRVQRNRQNRVPAPSWGARYPASFGEQFLHWGGVEGTSHQLLTSPSFVVSVSTPRHPSCLLDFTGLTHDLDHFNCVYRFSGRKTL